MIGAAMQGLRAAVLVVTAPLLAQQETYYTVPLGDLVKREQLEGSPRHRFDWSLAQTMRPYALLDGPGEARVLVPAGNWFAPDAVVGASMLCVKAPAGAAPKGRLWIAKPDQSGMLEVPFELGKERAAAADEGAARFAD